jgi:hypothetical protein
MSNYQDKKLTETKEYIEKNTSIKKELNSYKVDIDKTVFSKTAEEKEAIKKLKNVFKANLKEKYKKEWNQRIIN